MSFDTNAVSVICRGDDPVQTILDGLQRLDARLVIVPTTLMENYKGAARYAFHEATVLGQVEQQDPDGVAIAVAVDDLWAAERRGALASTPVVDPSVAGFRALAQDPNHFAAAHAANVPGMKGRLGTLTERIHEIETQARQDFAGPAFALDMIEADLRGPRLICAGWIKLLLDIDDLDQAKALIADSTWCSEHPAHVLHVGLFALMGLSVLYAHEHRTSMPWLPERRRHNDFFDANIATNSTYADWIVTDDANLAAGLHYLRTLRFRAPEPISIEQFSGTGP